MKVNQLVRVYSLPFQAAISVPLAVRYKSMPLQIMTTLQQIAYVESRYDTHADNKESSADGIYQIIDKTAVLKPLWKNTPAIVSVPLQHADLLIGKMRQPTGWNGGIDRLIIEHHGLVKFSAWKEDNNLDNEYYSAVKNAPSYPIPPIVLLGLPLALTLV